MKNYTRLSVAEFLEEHRRWYPSLPPRRPPTMADETKWPITVRLRDTVTGDARVWNPEDDYEWMPPDENGSGSEYVWSEGNYACDCNRALFLWDWEEAKQLPCGDQRILVHITRRDTGEVLYSDDPEADHG